MAHPRNWRRGRTGLAGLSGPLLFSFGFDTVPSQFAGSGAFLNRAVENRQPEPVAIRRAIQDVSGVYLRTVVLLYLRSRK